MKPSSVLRVLPVSCVLFAMASVVPGMTTVAVAGEEAHKVAVQDFRSHCASCHGWGGAGNGPVADVLKVRPPDLTRIAHRNGGTFPAYVIYKSIEGTSMPLAHGTTQMPVWGLWFTYQEVADSLLTGDTKPVDEKVAKRINGIVAYLESIQE